MNEPLLKRIARTAKHINSLAHDVAGLTRDINDLDPSDLEPWEDFEKACLTNGQALAVANRHFLELTGQIDALRAKGRAVAMTAGDAASYAADTVQIATQVDELTRTAYIPWARYTLMLMPDLFTFGVKEVASHEGGKEQLLALAAAIEKLANEVEG